MMPLMQIRNSFIMLKPSNGSEFEYYFDKEISENEMISLNLELSRDWVVDKSVEKEDKVYSIEGNIGREKAYIELPYVPTEDKLLKSVVPSFYSTIYESTKERPRTSYYYSLGEINITYPELGIQDLLDSYQRNVYDGKEENRQVLEFSEGVKFSIGDSINILENKQDISRDTLISRLSSDWREKITDSTRNFANPEFLKLGTEELTPLIWKSDKEGWLMREFLSILDRNNQEDDIIEILKRKGMSYRDIIINIFVYSRILSYEYDDQLDVISPNIPSLYPNKDFFDFDDWKDISRQSKVMIFNDMSIEKDKILLTHCPDTNNIVAIEIKDIDKEGLPIDTDIKRVIPEGRIVRVQPCEKSQRDSISIDEYCNMLEDVKDCTLNLTYGFMRNSEFVEKNKFQDKDLNILSSFKKSDQH